MSVFEFGCLIHQVFNSNLVGVGQVTVVTGILLTVLTELVARLRNQKDVPTTILRLLLHDILLVILNTQQLSEILEEPLMNLFGCSARIEEVDTGLDDIPSVVLVPVEGVAESEYSIDRHISLQILPLIQLSEEHILMLILLPNFIGILSDFKQFTIVIRHPHHYHLVGHLQELSDHIGHIR